MSSSSVVAVHVNTATRGHSLQIFNTPTGIEINKAILEGKTYPIIPFLKEVKTIVDVGANVGAASVVFALTYPEARILAFEPFPPAYQLLRQNLAAFERAQVFDFGLFDQDCRVPLFLSRFDPVTNSIGASRLNSDQSVEVHLRHACDVLRAQQVDEIDILKIDTEGCELPILRSLSDLLGRTKVIYLEYHDEADRIAMDAILKDTHVLVSARVMHPHRGELCYVAYRCFPAETEVEQLRIRFNGASGRAERADAAVAQRFRHTLGLLATVNKDLLLNRDFLIAMIRAAGSRNFGPYDDYAEENGPLLQDPPQFADALICLSRYRINSMVEVGSWRGYTACFLTAYLRRFNPDLTTTCIDPLKIERDPFGLPIQWQVGTSDNLAGRRFDLAFIDGDHSMPWVKRDYANVGVHAPICMFHDIDDGDYNIYDPGTFWEQLKQDEVGHIFFDFKHPSKHFMGIGIRVKQDYGK